MFDIHVAELILKMIIRTRCFCICEIKLNSLLLRMDSKTNDPYWQQSVQEPNYTRTFLEPNFTKTFPEPNYTRTFLEPNFTKTFPEPNFTKTFPEPNFTKTFPEPNFTKTFSEPNNVTTPGILPESNVTPLGIFWYLRFMCGSKILPRGGGVASEA